jgi:hypothetical protein
MARRDLPSVTLCAAASVNVAATVSALRASMEGVAFADCLLFTDADVPVAGTGIRLVPIPRLNSSRDYSDFIVRELGEHIRTSHCLIVQWDGFVIHPERWDPAFLEFDYIGAPWPQFEDGRDVGNGGFSLRSRRLLQACKDPRFILEGPEDVAICRLNRSLLEEQHDIRFADRAIAERFSYERRTPEGPTFGFHGVFNLIDAIGVHCFWDLYRSLDDRKTAFFDYWSILRQLGSATRRAKFTADRLAALFGG